MMRQHGLKWALVIAMIFAGTGFVFSNPVNALTDATKKVAKEKKQKKRASKKTSRKSRRKRPANRKALLPADKNTTETSAEDEKPKVAVEFFMPEMDEEASKKGTLRVIIPGQTKKATKVQFTSSELAMVTKDEKVETINVRDAIANPKKMALDENGFFEIHLDLPPGTIQIPLVIRAKDKAEADNYYQLSLLVDEEQVQLANSEALRTSPKFKKNYGFWFGTGYNYLKYSQQSADIDSNLQFSSFKGPSLYSRFWLRLSSTTELNLDFKYSPGATKSSEDITITEGSYAWLILGTEVIWLPGELSMFGAPAQYGLRAGIQYHTVPFLRRTGNSSSEFEVTDNTLAMATLGYHLNWFISNDWTLEHFLRYQYVAQAGDTFEITPSLAFDGSVGAFYSFPQNWRMGVYWYGQSHSYGYKLTDRFSNTEIEGDQSLFFSNIEFRLGYEW